MPILVHRVTLSNEARYTKRRPEDILSAILKETPVPPGRDDMFDEKSGK